MVWERLVHFSHEVPQQRPPPPYVRSMPRDTQDKPVDHLARFTGGNRTFSLLFVRWMDTNGWSHPTMVSLARAALYGASWLHSSQISGLRHVKLASPGPRTFIAIERLNYYLHRYATEKLLIPNTPSSNAYQKAYAITEDGKPPELGWWVEVFCGNRVPKDIELHEAFFTEDQAKSMSQRWGAMVRKLLLAQGIDLITELDRIIRERYPAKDTDRVARLVDVIHNRDAWTPDQLSNELPAISELTSRLGGPRDEDALLKELDRKAS